MTNLIDMVMVNSRLAAIGTYTAEEIDALYGQLTGKYVTLSYYACCYFYCPCYSRYT